jgi:hypothetical protein
MKSVSIERQRVVNGGGVVVAGRRSLRRGHRGAWHGDITSVAQYGQAW